MKSKLFIALLGAVSVHAVAQETLPEVVVTATRMPQSLNKSIADVQVFNEQAIRQSGAQDVLTLLRSITGVEVAQNGGLGSTSGVFMRGADPKHTLILLDGARVGSATSGATAIEHIMLNNVERIEIVRGNVSSLYGSEAIGGVIQIFTKQGKGPVKFNASVGIGNHDTARVSGGISGSLNNTAFSLNAARVQTDGKSALDPNIRPSANPNDNDYSNNAITAQIKHFINDDHMISASAFESYGSISLDSAWGMRTDESNTTSKISKYALVSENQLNKVWRSTVHLSQGKDFSDYVTNGAKISDYQTKNSQLIWQNNFSIHKNHRFNVAAEYLQQKVNSTVAFSNKSRQVHSFLGGYTGEFANQQLQLNTRLDNYSDFGTADTYLLGYGLNFKNNWRATASLSNAFKAPSFNDMYWPSAFGYQGNPNLRPEHSRNREFGLHYYSGLHRVDMVYFDNRVKDLISIKSDYSTVENIKRAKIKGIGVSYVADFENDHIRASFNGQKPIDRDSGERLVRRAREFGDISYSHDFKNWNIGGELRFSGPRPDAGKSLDGYEIFNLTTRLDLNKQWNISARIDNLFDRNYREVYGYNTLGRTVFVSVNYQ